MQRDRLSRDWQTSQLLIAAVTALVLVLLWGAAYLQADRDQRGDVEAAIRQNATLAIAFEEHTVRTLKAVDAAVLLIAREYERQGERLDLAALLQEGLIDGALFTAVSVIDERGNVVLSSGGVRGFNVADREHFKAHLANRSVRLEIGKPIVTRSTGAASIPMTRRLSKPDGSFGGIVSALVDPEYFLRFYEKAQVGTQGVAFLVGLEDAIARARRSGTTSTVGTDMSDSSVIKAAARARTGNLVTKGKIEGVRRYQSYRTLANYPLVVAVGASQAEVLAASARSARSYYAAAGAASVLVLACAVLLAVAARRNRRAQRALETSEAELRATFEQAAIGLSRLAPDGRFLRVNEKLCRMLGYTADELAGLKLNDMRHSLDKSAGVERELLAAGTASSAARERRYLCKDGALRWFRETLSVVHQPDGETAQLTCVLEDVTDRKDLERTLQELAERDRLTGLPNRAVMHDKLEQALQQAARRGWVTGVMFIDLDGFKLVNDTAGHAAGDRLLGVVAQRLRSCLRGEDTVGRLGGDEFVVILAELTQPDDALGVAEKVREVLSQSYEIDGREFYVTASIGIAMYPQDAGNVADLLRCADLAMYAAKLRGKNNCQVFTRQLAGAAESRVQLQADLRHALARGEFLLHYQPKTAAGSERITGVEALLRWRRPSGELVPAQDFVAVLEETGLILPVGDWVLDAACAQLATWRRQGIDTITMAVNLSARQFHQQDMVQIVSRVLERHRIPAASLELEITETAAMYDCDRAAEAIRALKKLGVRVALDDFGTGHSTLSYLKRFPVDCIKLDRSFVSGLATNGRDASLAQAIIALSHALGLTVVAEGVEQREQAAFLVDEGCDEMQGYLFSRPIPADACTSLLRKAHAAAAAACAA